MTGSALFERTSERQRWTKPLAELYPELRKRAIQAAEAPEGVEETRELVEERREDDRDWAWVVLRSGAVVAMRVRGDMWMRRELRIAREPPKTDDWRERWERELATFLETFGIEEVDGETPCERAGQAWWRHADREAEPGDIGPEVRFFELRHGEVTPGRARCAEIVDGGQRCGAETEWFPAGGVGGQRCRRHQGEQHAPRGGASE